MARSSGCFFSSLTSVPRVRKGGLGIVIGALALAGTATMAERQSRRAEQRHPARGAFVTSDGVRLHYLDRGNGRSVLFLHGNGGMIDDMLISGIVDRTSSEHRAIVVDRPGFGYSERPRGRAWGATAQAALLPTVLQILGLRPAIVVGHSWGTLVALALALDHPELVSGLVLASGYYYPTPRVEAPLASLTAAPVVGDLVCHTVGPLIGEAIAPAFIQQMFAPQPVTERFAKEFPVAMTLRPSQIHAFAEDTASMAACAAELAPRYGEIKCPVRILAGDADGIVDFKAQAVRLHEALANSTLDTFAGAGHMIHHHDPDRVVAAVRSLANVTATSSAGSGSTFG